MLLKKKGQSFHGYLVKSHLFSFLFSDYRQGGRTGSLLARRSMVLMMIAIITILALLFIQYNTQTILDSYNELEEISMNKSLHSLEDTIIIRSVTLENTTRDYAKWDETASYVREKNLSFVRENLLSQSLKNLGITFVAIIDQTGRVLYLKQYDPDTYQEITPLLTPENISLLINPDLDTDSSISSLDGTPFLIAQTGISSSDETVSHFGYLLFGTPLQPIIDSRIMDFASAGSSVQVVSSTPSPNPIIRFNLSSGGIFAIGAQNETWISGVISFTDPSSSSVIRITVPAEKQLLVEGRAFGGTYFLRSVIFLTLTISFGTLVIFLLFRRYYMARSALNVQEQELAMLRERREILDKFKIILDNYLHSGTDNDQNISLLTATARGLLNGTAAFYYRYEDGEYSPVCSWPKTDDRVHGWITGVFVHWLASSGLQETFCTDNEVIPLDTLPDGGAGILAASYPEVRSVVSRQIVMSDALEGNLILLLPDDTPLSEINQLILDLLVHALKGEENRRIAKLALKKRDVVLEAVGYSAARLIRDTSASSIIEILHKFVINIGITEAHVFVWKTDNHGNPILTHNYNCVEEDAHAQHHLNWQELLHSPLLSKIFGKGNHGIVAGSADMFPVELPFLENYGIRSIALIPFIFKEEIRGVLVLADHARKRSWHVTELDALKIASNLIMGAIARIEREEEHQKREENFRQFFNHLNIFIFVLDQNGRIITANLFAQQEMGIKASDLKGMRLSGIFTSRWMQEPFSPEEKGMAPYSQEQTGVLLTIEGKEIPVEMRYLPGVWDGNQVIFCICKDISHLKRSEHKFASAFRSSQVLHAIWNLRDDRLIDANTTFFETTGFTRKDLIRSARSPKNEIFNTHKHDDLKDQFNHIKEVILTEGSIQDHEIELKTKSGDIRQGSLYGALIEIDEEPCALFSIVDITDRKRAELRVQTLLKELSDSNQGLHDFAHIVAHDLKDPLRGIYSLASWIGEDFQEQIGPDGQRYVRMIGEQVQRMYQLIDGILAYSLAGLVREERELVSIRHVIQDVLETLAPPPSVRIIIETEMPDLYTERTKIQQVFQNLIGNSLVHLGREDGEIRIRSRHLGKNWQFEIADNGPGIDPSLHNSIFEIFRSYPSPGGKKGTGIGLSIVKRIVETSGGSIWVKSEPGMGATFCFTLGASGEPSHDDGSNGGGADDTNPLY